MTIYCKIFVLMNILSLITAHRTEDWPPEIVIELFGYSFPGVGKCFEESKVDIRKFDEFETSTDWENLPNDRALKCFILCAYIEFGLAIPGSTKLYLAPMFDAIAAMTDADRLIYVRMTSGCTKQKSKDMCDALYDMNVCMKKNDNEHYYLIYDMNYLNKRVQKMKSHENDVTKNTSLSEK